MWILKDTQNLYFHERPNVTNDLNVILENAIFTNRCLLELKKKSLSTEEYKKFSNNLSKDKNYK